MIWAGTWDETLLLEKIWGGTWDESCHETLLLENVWGGTGTWGEVCRCLSPVPRSFRHSQVIKSANGNFSLEFRPPRDTDLHIVSRLCILYTCTGTSYYLLYCSRHRFSALDPTPLGKYHSFIPHMPRDSPSSLSSRLPRLPPSVRRDITRAETSNAGRHEGITRRRFTSHHSAARAVLRDLGAIKWLIKQLWPVNQSEISRLSHLQARVVVVARRAAVDRLVQAGARGKLEHRHLLKREGISGEVSRVFAFGLRSCGLHSGHDCRPG
jgi:hypothetical protein